MEQNESLSEVLSGSPFTNPSPAPEKATDVKPVEKTEVAATSAAKEPEVKAEPEAAKSAEVTRDDKGRFTKAEANAEKPEPTAPIAALQDERRKRQELEAKYREAVAKLEEAKPKTDFFADPEKAFAERAEAAMTPIQEKYFRLSMKVAAQLHGDFNDAAEAFSKAIDSDPRLMAEWRNSDDPGEYAYRVGMQLRELADVGGDLRAYRSKIEAGVNTKLEDAMKQIASLQSELAALKKGKEEVSQVSESLNSKPSRATGLADTDPDDITQLVRFGNHKIA